MTIRKIKKDISYRDLGGKDFVVDYAVTNTLNNDEVFNNALCGNYACYNFLRRRPDFNRNFPHKLYYGKVKGLGYIISEDELE